MSYICDSCGNDIRQLTEEHECAECGQEYLLDPTQVDIETAGAEESQAHVDQDSVSSDSVDSGSSQHPSETEQESLENPDEDDGGKDAFIDEASDDMIYTSG